MYKFLLLEIILDNLPNKILKKIPDFFFKKIYLELKKKYFLKYNSKFLFYINLNRISILLKNINFISKFNIKKIFFSSIFTRNNKKNLILFNYKNVTSLYILFKLKKNILSNLLKNIFYKIISNLFKFNFIEYIDYYNKNIKNIREIHNILLKIENKTIILKNNNIISNTFTYGNKFLIKKFIYIKNPIKYDNYLIKYGKIIVNHNIKKNIILLYFFYFNKKIRYFKLYNNIIFLTEWPNIYKIKFKKKFLQLPNKYINFTINKNKNCLLLYKKKNQFLFFSNIEKLDKFSIKKIKLSINFLLLEIYKLYKNDLKKNFNKKLFLLKNIIYHSKLGNELSSLKRLIIISKYISNLIKFKKTLNLEKLIIIYKINLTNSLVKRFKELKNKIILNQFNINIKNNKKLIIIFNITILLENVIGLWGINLNPKYGQDLFGIKKKVYKIIKILLKNNLIKYIKKIIIKSIGVFKNIKLFNINNNNILNYFNSQVKNILILYNFKENQINSLVFNGIYINNLIKKLIIIKKLNNNLILLSRDYKRIENIFNIICKKKIFFLIKKYPYINYKLLNNKYEYFLLKYIISYNMNINFKKYLFNLFKFKRIINIFINKTFINRKNMSIKLNYIKIINNIRIIFNKKIIFFYF